MIKWSSRKLWVAIAFQCLFAGLLVAEKLPPSSFEFLTLVTIGGYFIGNVGEHLSARR